MAAVHPHLLMASRLMIWNGHLYIADEIPMDLKVRELYVTVRGADDTRIAVYAVAIGLARNMTLYGSKIAFPQCIIRQQQWQKLKKRRIAIAMAFHSRLGAASALRVVDAAVVGAMVFALY